MGNTTGNVTPSDSKPTGLLNRLKKINRICVATVIVPTTLAVLYFGLFASDIYVSESRFVIRSASHQQQTSLVGTLLQGSSLGHSQDDTYPVVDYIESRDALRELNQNDYIANAYSEHGDWISHFNRSLDDSFEALWRYYGNHIVTVDLDATSGIATLQVRAYSAADAERINTKLLDISERLINRMNDRATNDTLRFAKLRVSDAAARAKNAAAKMASYRNSNTVFDPDKQSALQLQQVTMLQKQLLSARTELIQLQTISPKNPQITVLQTNIASLEQQIKDTTGNVAGGKGSLSDKAATYARLQLDSQFADKQLSAAMAALETAQDDAQRKQLYLERLVQANTPDVATEPKRLKAILEVFALGMILWGVLSLLLAGVREHND
ncbi:hypothetical protein [Burkholderia sp. Ac-20379]|uniref:hypothetical protein n=1 Tax=Burkholderia sp. Ac-20379 TaxID=2703900 RepID=UPI0019819ABF|nr:hypothetical protein [Burkholderia sp. Ac-20379]MBN3724965.1 hypothetical protein [Burkholderia sp. Ac-20379]